MGFSWGGAGSGAVSGASAGSSFGPWGTVIGGVGGGLLGGFFGGGDDDDEAQEGSVERQPLLPPWMMALGEDYSGFLRKYLQNYEPGKEYDGRLSVDGPSSFEKIGLEQLGQYLENPGTGQAFSAAKNQAINTLEGKYADPNTSPFIKSMSVLAKQNLNDAIDDTRGRRGARGTYFTRAGLEEESQLTERTQNALNAVIGDFIQSERGRQIDTIPYAQSLDTLENQTVPLKKLEAASTVGALPRILEQAALERQYNDFTRKQKELGAIPNLAGGFFGTSVPYEYQTTPTVPSSSSSGLSSLTDNIGPLVDLAIQLFQSRN